MYPNTRQSLKNSAFLIGLSVIFLAVVLYFKDQWERFNLLAYQYKLLAQHAGAVADKILVEAARVHSMSTDNGVFGILFGIAAGSFFWIGGQELGYAIIDHFSYKRILRNSNRIFQNGDSSAHS